MEISSVASQALSLRDQTSNAQLGIMAIKEATDSQNKIAEMLAKNSQTVQKPPSAEPGRFSTYA